MILKTDYSALVVVGLWNKGIFNPDWVKRFLLPDGEKLHVEFPINVDGSQRVSSEKIRIFVIGNKLNFVPLNTYDETLEIIQDLAVKTADYLPHTPVNSFGINFIFETTDKDEIPERLLQFNHDEKLIEYGARISESSHSYSLDFDQKRLNLKITKQDVSRVEFNFNFHFDITDLAQFKEKIDLNPILDLKREATSMMKDIYNLELQK